MVKGKFIKAPPGLPFTLPKSLLMGCPLEVPACSTSKKAQSHSSVYYLVINLTNRTESTLTHGKVTS